MPKVVDYSLPKPCKTCKRILPPEEYRRALCPASKPEAKKTECKSCADERLRNWREKNPKRVAMYQQKDRDGMANVRAKAHSKRMVAALPDRYIKKLLRSQDVPDELVETKRAQLLLNRLISEKEKV